MTDLLTVINWQEVALSIFASVITSGIVGFAFREKIKSYLAIDTQRAVNAHKQELDSLTEALKFELQREMVRAQLYTQNAHSTYPELYKLILKAHGAITGFHGYKRIEDYKNYVREEIFEELTRRKVGAKLIGDVMSAFDRNPNDGAEEMKKVVRLVELSEAEGAFWEAKNYWLKNELFIDENISNLIGPFFTDLWRLYIDAEMAIAHHYHKETDEEARERVNTSIVTLKKMMQEQLAPSAQSVQAMLEGR